MKVMLTYYVILSVPKTWQGHMTNSRRKMRRHNQKNATMHHPSKWSPQAGPGQAWTPNIVASVAAPPDQKYDSQNHKRRQIKVWPVRKTKSTFWKNMKHVKRGKLQHLFLLNLSLFTRLCATRAPLSFAQTCRAAGLLIAHIFISWTQPCINHSKSWAIITYMIVECPDRLHDMSYLPRSSYLQLPLYWILFSGSLETTFCPSWTWKS